jgi:hypothetical protein
MEKMRGAALRGQGRKWKWVMLAFLDHDRCTATLVLKHDFLTPDSLLFGLAVRVSRVVAVLPERGSQP